jgi:hypothetical protein
VPDSPGPEPFGEILSRLFASRGWGRQQERLRLEKAWSEAAGNEWIEETRVAVLRRNVLEIEVRSPVLLQELSQFHKRRLLEAIRGILKGVTIKDLRFKIGVW